MKTVCLLAALGGLWSTASVAVGAQAQASTPPLTLSELERRALDHNPTLPESRAAVDASRGRATQAGLVPNPTMGYVGGEISPGPVIRGGEHGFFVEQTIPLGGKLGLSRSVFQHETMQAEQLADAQRMRVVNAVRTSFYEVLAARRRVDVRERLTRLAAEAVDVSRQLFNTGAADRPDVLQSEIEAQQEQLSLTAARNDLDRAWRRLASVVGDPSLRPAPLDGSIDAIVPELTREDVVSKVLAESPEIKAARAAVERAEAALARAKREPVPDLFLRGGPQYNRELLEANGRPVGWEAAVEVGVTVPLFNRNQGGIAATVADASHARSELARLELSLKSRVADVFDAYLTALRTTDSYRDQILPRAEEAYRLYLTRYREMAAAYPQVLIAQRTVFQANEQYVTAAEEAWRAEVALDGLLLDGGLDRPAQPGENAAGDFLPSLIIKNGRTGADRIQP